MNPVSLRAAQARARDQRPFANGTEYEIWSGHWCSRCARDVSVEKGGGCPLLTIALVGQRTPAEWLEIDTGDRAERYQCIEFRPRAEVRVPSRISPAAAAARTGPGFRRRLRR